MTQPWAVAFVKKGSTPVGGRTFCSGVLVHREWVLTAKHCLTSSRGWPGRSNVTVVIGRQVLPTSGGETRGVRSGSSDIRQHPSLDIALVRLSSPSTKTPLPLASRTEMAAAQRRVLMYGYGQTSVTSTSSSDRLRLASTTIVSTASNKSWVKTRTAYASLCNKDSGGPLVVNVDGRSRLVGVAHGAMKEGISGVPVLGEWFRCDKGRTNAFYLAGYGSPGYTWIRANT